MDKKDYDRELLLLLGEMTVEKAVAIRERDEALRRVGEMMEAIATHMRKESDALGLVAQHMATVDDLGLDVDRLERQKEVLEIEVTSAHAALVEARKEIERLTCVVAYHERCPPLKGGMT